MWPRQADLARAFGFGNCVLQQWSGCARIRLQQTCPGTYKRSREVTIPPVHMVCRPGRTGELVEANQIGLTRASMN